MLEVEESTENGHAAWDWARTTRTSTPATPVDEHCNQGVSTRPNPACRWRNRPGVRFGDDPPPTDRCYRAPDAACSMSSATAAGCET
jgi:hypothetical protein